MDILTLIVVVLLVLWATGSFVFPVGSLINVLLVIVLIIVIVRVMRGDKVL